MKRSKELIETFGDEALQALNNGTEWEYSPETIECGNWFPYWCDDCETWHQQWYMTGYRIEDGHVYEVIHSCDTDGNWEVEDEYDVDDPDYERWTAQYAYPEADKAAREYSQWVVDHDGDDPLGEFCVQHETRQTIPVVIHYCDNQFWFHSAQLNGEWTESVDDLPERARQFFHLEDGAKLDIDDLGWENMDQFVQEAQHVTVKSHDELKCECEIEVDVPRPEAEVKIDIVSAARRHLDRKW